MPLKVAIIGRPNVGKSTLFNRLVGRRLALVDDAPGVTRDRREASANLGGLALHVIDTGGLSAGKTALDARVTKQSEQAIADADVVLFLMDARAGLTPADRAIAHGLRKHQPKVLLAANKCESRAGEAGLYEAFELGFGEPIALSAEHGLGLSDLLTALKAHQKKHGKTDTDEEDETRPVTLAVIGRPNTGKSTLVNRLLGEERMLTGPEAGITRDAVTVPLTFGRREYRLVDTAGMRRRARVTEKLERLSVADALRALRYADVAILVLDANEPFETQDLSLADLAEREGRAVIFAVNKWDLVEHGPVLRGKLRKRADELLPQLKGAPFVTLSALTGAGIERLMAAVDEVYRLWNAKLPTARVNKFLEAALEKNPPPAVRGRRIKLRYMTQIKARPPTFVIFGNQVDALPESYRRYLVHAMRDAFKLPGVPIRLQMRQTENPFDKRKSH